MRKETLEHRLDNKLCTRCGEPVVHNRKMCVKHLEESKLKEKRKRERRKNSIICVRCGQRPPRPNRVQCFICANENKDQYNAAKMDIYYQRRSFSNCVRCGKLTNNFSVHCDVCAVYMKNKDKIRYDKSMNSGLCVRCHKLSPINEEVLCLICKEKNATCCKDNRIKQKLTVISYYGGQCQICGETDTVILCIDHIDGGGNQHRNQLRLQGTTFYRWIVKNNYPNGFQVLCYNCNIRKHLNGGVCPHKTDNA